MCLESVRFQERLVEDIEMQVSTRLEVCLCKHGDMFPSSLREAELLCFFSQADPGRSQEGFFCKE